MPCQVAANRQTGQNGGSTLREILFRGLKCHHDRICFFGKQLIGHARISVLLVNRRRNMQLLRRTDDRAGGVSARSDCQIGCKVLHDALRIFAGSHQIACRLDIPLDIGRRKTPLEACHLHIFHVIACRRHECCLHAVRCSDKQKFRFRYVLFDDPGNRKTGIDMSARSAASNQYSHLHVPLISSFVQTFRFSGAVYP